MRFGIVGAGAIGGLIGVSLARQGHEVAVLSRGRTLDTLREQGWSLETAGARRQVRVAASDDAATLGERDILFITVKGPALAAAVRAAAPMIGASTIVIPAMNGVPWWFLLAGGGSLPAHPLKSVDPDGEIGRAVPLDNVLGCVVHASAYVSAPATVVRQAGNRLIFGEPAGGPSERLNAVAAPLADAGFETTRSENIRREIWYKLWGNMTMNPISALVGATSDRILNDDLVRAFMMRVMAEAAEIGNRIGCEIHESSEDRIAVARKLGIFKTSMLQDAESGRPLEIDQLLSAPQEIARLVGVSTPNLDSLLGLARLYARERGLY